MQYPISQSTVRSGHLISMGDVENLFNPKKVNLDFTKKKLLQSSMD